LRLMENRSVPPQTGHGPKRSFLPASLCPRRTSSDSMETPHACSMVARFMTRSLGLANRDFSPAKQRLEVLHTGRCATDRGSRRARATRLDRREESRWLDCAEAETE